MFEVFALLLSFFLSLTMTCFKVTYSGKSDIDNIPTKKNNKKQKTGSL